ncbi:hypothetical protein BT96DRAFT_813635 [Gymnopus androsaceus JB14]|uniref:DUF1793-domain-containing protein n=1 Tax=Gymnopus androsaceus JB14 TaxID=1447944 RepID=A0A6A4HY76_9AGAR|nr:hypothetical protein BT96DRAFT_813635 [Gymnopus androsaceus JB14]
MLNAFLSLPLVLLFTIFASRVDSQFISAQNFLPVSYPLAVRSPYLNAWIDTPDRTTSLNVWPTHWDNNNVGFARIDGVAWQWMGEGGPGNTTTVLTSEITPTQSRFSVLAGSVVLNITFFSPIEPLDLVKQSFPFVYLSVEATSIDGNEHDVQLYSDITAEWISGDRTKVAVWQTVVSSTDVYHQASLQNPEPMTEITNIAEDSTVYYSMQTVSKMTYQSGISGTMRSQFGSTGSLSDTQDNTFQAINAGGFIAFAFAVDLGSSTSFTTPTVWALGIVRDPVIQYVPQAGSSQSQNRRSYFWTQFSSIGNAISAFLSDYTDAVQRATALEQRITSAAQSISTDFADLVSFGARQALTSDITISQDSNGAWNYSDVLAFQRDTGKSRRVNAVETLYATMPVHLYLNASWLGMHLQPLLQYQDSSGYQNGFASPDLGMYSGLTEIHLRSTGNMLIMTWAHARMSGDGTLIKRYYDLLKRWTNFLVTNSLLQNNQISADGLQNVNMTNLAIKGILGVAAMAQISSATGEDADAQAFKANASALYQTWKSLALSSSNSGHLLPTYGNTAASGYALMYNMYPDNLLGLGVIEESVYEAQAAYYSTLAQSAGQFGLTFDTSSNGEANSAWTLFTAGSIANSSTGTRNELVSMVYARANSNASTSVGSFPTYYNDTTGASPTPGGGQAR